MSFGEKRRGLLVLSEKKNEFLDAEPWPVDLFLVCTPAKGTKLNS